MRLRAVVDPRMVGALLDQHIAAGAPRNTPHEIIEKLNREVNVALADPTIRTRFTELGVTAVPGSSADFAKLIADETEKWAKVVKFAGIKPA